MLHRIGLKSILMALLFVLFYFGIWRDVRSVLTVGLVQPVAQHWVNHSSTGYGILKTRSRVTFHLAEQPGELTRDIPCFDSLTDAERAGYDTIFTFKGFGGRFFLICGFALLITGAYKMFFWLFAFHQATTLAFILLLAGGLFIHPLLFYVMDMMLLYFVPVFSVMMVVFGLRSGD